MGIKVLFICVHNSARSQMAEELLKKYGAEKFDVESAGFVPTSINPFVVKVMKEEGIDLTDKKTQSVYDLVKSQKFFGYVITVCNRIKESDCPIFPGVLKKMQWDLENPEDFIGSEEEITEQVRDLKNQIKERIINFINDYGR
jgi:arsenate reductase (thioredoxin)